MFGGGEERGYHPGSVSQQPYCIQFAQGLLTGDAPDECLAVYLQRAVSVCTIFTAPSTDPVNIIEADEIPASRDAPSQSYFLCSLDVFV